MFGKNIMGIIASLLIFIGLVSFAVLIYDQLPNFAKIGGMFLLSGALVATGLLLGRKQKTPFSTSLLGCGIGSVYISIITTHLVFNAIPSLAVYLFLLVWVVGILFITQKFQYGSIFRLVCQLGILFSVGLAWMSDLSALEYILISLYTYAGFFIIERKNTSQNLIFNLGNILIATTFAILCSIHIANPPAAPALQVLLTVINPCLFAAFILFRLFATGKLMPAVTRFGVVALSISTVLLFIGLGAGLAPLKEINHASYYLAFMALILVVNLPAIAKNIHLSLYQGVLVISAIVFAALGNGLANLLFPSYGCTGLLLVYVPLLCWGIAKKRGFYLQTAHVFLILDIIATYFLTSYNAFYTPMVLPFISAVWYGIMLLCLAATVVYLYKNRLTTAIEPTKFYLYFAANFIILLSMLHLGGEFSVFYGLVGCGLLHFITVSSGYFYKWDSSFRFFPKNTSPYEIGFANKSVFLLVVSSLLFLIYIPTLLVPMLPLPLHILLVLTAALHVIIRIRPLYTAFAGSRWLGTFIGGKTTLFVLAVMLSIFNFSNYPYLISLLLLLVACSCIYIGFAKNFASLRIYGLVLTIASVLKLVTIDIAELNSIVRVGAFIGGGLLCFIVSRLYNTAHKKALAGAAVQADNNTPAPLQNNNVPPPTGPQNSPTV
ncbi:DUF2339 domain-containing protein, partial [Ruminococcaceae bacterium OttesenSCG-928-A16]|nr:DUF2339 domain-containing protein [Ruminococcaceae bacterium OttesenSCG-928-A16]